MPTPPTPGRRRLRRWLPVPLSIYAIGLLLAAWPEEVRPEWADTPRAVAILGLAKLGISGGIAVFEPPRERITRVLLNDCIYVRGHRDDAEPEWLQPPDGRCVLEGPRLSIPRREWVVRSLLLRASTPLNQAVVGDWFCHPQDAPPFDFVDVLWSQEWRALYGEERGVSHVVLYRWRCDPPGIVYDQRSPSDLQVRQVWGEP
ncbi:MAG: hypothetical protein ACQGVK_22930 [Myxococcota bacterium]